MGQDYAGATLEGRQEVERGEVGKEKSEEEKTVAFRAHGWYNKGMKEMTDPQMLTLALAVIIPVSLLIYSNSRITEAKETLRSEMQTLRVEMKAGFEQISALLKVHELEHHHK